MAIIVKRADVRNTRFNPNIVTKNLSFYLDYGNPRSYDGVGSTSFDLSGFSRNGNLINSPLFVNQGPSSYINFDGIDDNLTTGYPITSTPALGNWSYEIWVEIDAYPTALSVPNIYGNRYRAGTLFGALNNAGAAIYWSGSNSGDTCIIRGTVRGNDANRSTSGFIMSLNTTYQFTLVNNYSFGLIFLYVNGNPFAITTSPTQEYNAGNVSGLNIGISQPQADANGQGNYSYFPGRIKNAKIYGIALNNAQVSQNFHALRGRYGV